MCENAQRSDGHIKKSILQFRSEFEEITDSDVEETMNLSFVLDDDDFLQSGTKYIETFLNLLLKM